VKEHYLKMRRYNTSNILNFRDYLLIIFIVERNIDIIVMELWCGIRVKCINIYGMP
jgi:hypothetical protein